MYYGMQSDFNDQQTDSHGRVRMHAYMHLTFKELIKATQVGSNVSAHRIWLVGVSITVIK